MSDTYNVVVGEKGRIVVPAEVREGHGWTTGTRLVAIDEEDGVVLMDLERLEARVRRQLVGANLVESLLADRRREAAREDEES